MREGFSYTYPPLSITRFSFIQLSELEQCRVKKLAQGFNPAARIRTRVHVVESTKLYPWATALYNVRMTALCGHQSEMSGWLYNTGHMNDCISIFKEIPLINWEQRHSTPERSPCLLIVVALSTRQRLHSRVTSDCPAQLPCTIQTHSTNSASGNS